MTDPETIASLRRALANATGREMDAANQRDHYRRAVRDALKAIDEKKLFTAIQALKAADAGDSPDLWTYVTDDDASLPPVVGERVLVWDIHGYINVAEWNRGLGQWYIRGDVGMADADYVKAWQLVQPPKKKEAPNAL